MEINFLNIFGEAASMEHPAKFNQVCPSGDGEEVKWTHDG